MRECRAEAIAGMRLPPRCDVRDNQWDTPHGPPKDWLARSWTRQGVQLNPFHFLARRTRLRLLAALALTAAAVGIAIPVTATLPGSSFESDDGNLVVDGPAGSKDWANAPKLAIGVDAEQTST